jgi:hypothetical protein
MDGQMDLKILAVRLPMAWGPTTRLANVVLLIGPSTVRMMPVTTDVLARNMVATARMILLRMVVSPE